MSARADIGNRETSAIWWDLMHTAKLGCSHGTGGLGAHLESALLAGSRFDVGVDSAAT